MRKHADKWYRLRRKILKVLGISGAAFIFQAGYGMRQPDLFSGRVLSGMTSEPVANVKVSIRPDLPGGKKNIIEIVTDSSGSFYYNLPSDKGEVVYIIDFEDTDSGENGGQFMSKRLIHHLERDGRYIEIKLDEK
jgi:hypothetical protein